MGIIGEHVFERDEKKAALSVPVFSSCRRPSQIPGPRIWLRSGHNRVGGGSAVAHTPCGVALFPHLNAACFGTECTPFLRGFDHIPYIGRLFKPRRMPL
jgi:hypothetical protein